MIEAHSLLSIIDRNRIMLFQPSNVSYMFLLTMFQIAFANPGVGVAQKMQEAGFMDLVGREWFFLTVGEAVQVCCSKLGLHPL
jgi:hypothetical protein